LNRAATKKHTMRGKNILSGVYVWRGEYTKYNKINNNFRVARLLLRGFTPFVFLSCGPEIESLNK